MKAKPDFRKESYEAALLLCNSGFSGVILAFDYKIISVQVGEESKPGAQFFTLPAENIVSGVVSGELPLGVE